MNLDDLRRIGFDVRTRNHARAVLTEDFPAQLAELCHVLGTLRINAEELVRGGGGEAQLTQRLRRSLASRHWVKRNIVIRKIVDDEEREGTSHEIDHVRKAQSGSIALELEWNNKDPFFDRDLENFQRLHAEGVISVGVIVTRGASLQNNIRSIIRDWAIEYSISGFSDLVAYGVRPTQRQRDIVERSNKDFVTAWSHQFTSDKFGTATTHWDKLQQRIDRGVGNPCPLLLLGVPDEVVFLQTSR